MSFSKEIKSFVLAACNTDFVGIAPASALADEPEGYRPTDILPNAKSLIVFGKRLADGATQAAFRYFEDNNKPARSGYAAYASELAPNFVLLFDTFNISQYIERTFGKTAMPLPCGPMQNAVPGAGPKPFFAGAVKAGLPLDIDKAAMAAGLGEFGWSNRLLTEEFGPRVQFGCVVTSMELDYDKPYSGPKLCDPSKCRICVDVCPTKAISADESIEKTAGGKTVKVAKINFNRCVVAACGLKKAYGGPIDAVSTDDPGDEELTKAFERKPLVGINLDHYPKNYCDKCLLYCPVGSWNKRFKDTGLSKK